LSLACSMNSALVTSSEPDRTMGVSLLCRDSCAPHPWAVGASGSESHRRAPVTTQAPWETV
jgi:hypothetical protein